MQTKYKLASNILSSDGFHMSDTSGKKNNCF